MIKYGEHNRLKVNREVDFGAYLIDEDTQQEVLIPKRYIPANTQVGDELEVFVYFDSEDRLIATTETPKAQVGEFAYLKVIAVSRVGAFLNWGLTKDLLLPYREQKRKVYTGSHYLVRIYVDDKTNRIVATTKVGRYLEDAVLDELEIGQEVDIIVCDHNHIGYQVIVNKKFLGLLYENEVFRKLEPGEQTKAYIRKIRWDDFKIDVRLQR
ncbi:MAG TPA: GntR family transcriptional regulator, partial [Microscillaceae bacterium]|nr:GntR family transcriptional regulator [Microscillaceae bacterium]